MGFRRDLSINNKIFLAYIPAVLLVVTVFFLSFSSMMRTYAIREICAARVSLLEQVADKLGYLQDSMVYISNSFLLDENTRSFLSKTATDAYSVKLRSDNMLQSITRMENIFLNVEFYTTVCGVDEARYISSSPYRDKAYDLSRMKSYFEAIGPETSRLVWMKTVNHDGSTLMSAARCIFNVHTGDVIGMIIFDFEEKNLADTFRASVGEGEEFLIANRVGDILSSSTGAAGGSLLGQPFFTELEGYRKGYFYDEALTSMVCFSRYEGLSWYVLSITPYDGLAGAKRPETYEYLMLFTVSLLLVSLLAALFLSQVVVRPIRRLTREIQRFHNHEGNAIHSGKMGDEVGYLTDNYHDMIGRIDQLIGRIIDEQEQKRAFEILALQSQINPHFLYNTLQSIRFLNRTGERDKLEQTTLALVRLLANLFDKQAGPHTLRDELALLEDYVFIQQVRYGSNFQMTYTVDEADMDCTIDKLVLQPIVENAIFHGLSTVEMGGLIELSAGRVGERLRIEVRDNGVGEQSAVTASATVVRHGMGLDNVRSRLRLLYDGDFLLELIYPADGGALVIMEVPRRMADAPGGAQKGDADR